jgi:hypothetical protein
MTPSKMMLGREINLPSELIFKNGREELFEHEEQYVTSLRNNIPKNTRNCQENLDQNEQRTHLLQPWRWFPLSVTEEGLFHTIL